MKPRVCYIQTSPGGDDLMAMAPVDYIGELFDSPTLFVSPRFLLESPYPFEVEIPKGEPPDVDIADTYIRVPRIGRVWKLTGKPHTSPAPMGFFEARWPD